VATTELARTNNHEPPTHLGFHLLRCDTAKAISSCLSMYICDRESRSLELSSLVILHWESVNKVFGKHSTQLIDRFSKFVITAHLPLHRDHVWSLVTSIMSFVSLRGVFRNLLLSRKKCTYLTLESCLTY
jgi:hypothetical protein